MKKKTDPVYLKRQHAKHILMVLQGQQFSDWYKDEGDFGNYVTRYDLPTKTQAEILDQIERMFFPKS